MMRKRFLEISFVFILALILPTSAYAIPLSDTAREHWNAPDNSVVITYDGSLDLVRVDFIHYAKDDGYAKPNAPGKSGKTEVGYELMRVKWLWQEDFAINYSGLPGTLSREDVSTVIYNSAKTWDDATNCSKTTNADLFGYGLMTTDTVYGTYDDSNTVAFGEIDNPTVIAVTSVWFSRATKTIYEFDMLFNTTYDWSTTGDPAAMDLQNIATHEFGHAIGLADIYKDTFDYVTMYGYASFGETNKVDLDNWDIVGVRAMYGD